MNNLLDSDDCEAKAVRGSALSIDQCEYDKAVKDICDHVLELSPECGLESTNMRDVPLMNVVDSFDVRNLVCFSSNSC